MVECKDVRKGIIRLQWELKMMEMQIEDLNNKARDIRKLKLSEEQQDVSAVVFKTNLILACLAFLRDVFFFFYSTTHWLINNIIIYEP